MKNFNDYILVFPADSGIPPIYVYFSKVFAIKDEWHTGTWDSENKSFDKHYQKHGKEVSANNEEQYLNKAVNFKIRVLKGGASISNIKGGTEGVKRYKKDGKYIDLAPNGKIISFGKK